MKLSAFTIATLLFGSTLSAGNIDRVPQDSTRVKHKKKEPVVKKKCVAKDSTRKASAKKWDCPPCGMG
jgi:hypothetical protein